MWDKMTPEERRIAIAKDVIEHLDQMNIMSKNAYMQVFEGDFVKNEGTITKEECSLLRDNCEVCARGALFISRIDLFNTVDWTDLDLEYYDPEEEEHDLLSSDITSEKLEGAFSKQDLGLIESAFEFNRNHGMREECSRFDSTNAEYFGLQYDNDKDRLRAIMNNIVQNGNFKVK
jgi:hypothetical protein